MAGLVVTAHQPNFLPGLSVVQKVQAADVVIWLDEVSFSHGSFTNRNRLPSGKWMTVPVTSGAPGKPINRVKIGQPKKDWRAPLVEKMREQFPPSDALDRVCAQLFRPHRSLIGLNVTLLDVVLAEYGAEASWHFQSHLDGGHAVTAVSDDVEELLPISARLAMMVEEIGGSVYLSGQSGRGYLDEASFSERGISVEYWQHDGDNPCVLGMLTREEALHG